MLYAIFCSATVAWIYYDCTKNRIGRVPGKTNLKTLNLNLPGWGWALLAALVPYLVLPVYLYKRKTLIAQGQEAPILGRRVRLVAVLIGIFSFVTIIGALPTAFGSGSTGLLASIQAQASGKNTDIGEVVSDWISSHTKLGHVLVGQEDFRVLSDAATYIVAPDENPEIMLDFARERDTGTKPDEPLGLKEFLFIFAPDGLKNREKALDKLDVERIMHEPRGLEYVQLLKTCVAKISESSVLVDFYIDPVNDYKLETRDLYLSGIYADFSFAGAERQLPEEPGVKVLHDYNLILLNEEAMSHAQAKTAILSDLKSIPAVNLEPSLALSLRDEISRLYLAIDIKKFELKNLGYGPKAVFYGNVTHLYLANLENAPKVLYEIAL